MSDEPPPSAGRSPLAQATEAAGGGRLPSRDPLHGITLEAMLDALVAHFGWAGLAERLPINSFRSDPSIPSSLKFLRRTPWARAKVESLYLFMRRERARAARGGGRLEGSGG